MFPRVTEGFWEQFNPKTLRAFAYKRLALYDESDLRSWCRECISDLGSTIEFIMDYGDSHDETEESLQDLSSGELRSWIGDILYGFYKGELIDLLADYEWLDEDPKDFIIESFEKFNDWPEDDSLVVFHHPNQLPLPF